MIFALQTKRVPTVDLVKNWLILLLFCVGQLNHADSMLNGTGLRTPTAFAPNYLWT